MRPAFYEITNHGIRRGAQLVAGAVKVATPFVEQGDVVGDRESAFHVMGNHNGCHSELSLQPADEQINAVGHDGVKSCRGLVVEHAARLTDEGAGQSDPFAHPAAEIDRHLGLLPGEVDHLQGLCNLGGHDRLVRFAALPQGKGHVVGNSQGVKERAILEEHAHRPPDLGQLAFGQAGNDFLADRYGPRDRLHQPDKMTQEDTFAPAASAEENQGFSLVNFETEAAQDFLIAERLDEVIDPDDLAGVGLLGHLPAGKKTLRVMVRKKFTTRMKSEPMTTASVVARPTPTAPSRALSP